MADVRLVLGNCLEVMRGMEANSVDSICTDPPYMIDFMEKKFDTSKDNIAGRVELWAECLRVAKPGAFLLAFGGDRTHHRMMVAIEDAGWEIRTCLYWVFGSGFPKSMDIGKAIDKAAGVEREVIGPNPYNSIRGSGSPSWGEGKLKSMQGSSNLTAPATDAAKQWDGWGTALKPAAEIIVMARKKLSERTVAANVLKWGTGGINVDACRIEANADDLVAMDRHKNPTRTGWVSASPDATYKPNAQGRWPANLLLDEEAAALLDEQSGERPGAITSGGGTHFVDGVKRINPQRPMYGDTGGASRFFYVAKSSRRDRNEGLEGMPERVRNITDGHGMGPINTSKASNGGIRENRPTANHHPTVKPTQLMRWLCRLVTPANGTILDPFMGSGSTLKAAILEGFDCVGIELDPDYFAIAERRIADSKSQPYLLELT